MTAPARPDIENFAELFLNDVPMMDVRAPIEFERGSFPNAVNIPLMNDKEREAVGTVYKQKGKDEAVELGYSFVQGEVKAERLAKWLEFAKQNPEGCLFCFRGGMRSHIVQTWMKEAGVDYPLIIGGYKAIRHFLMESIDRIAEQRNFAIISGRTGVGKTIVINSLPNAVDLERLANHRGSSFGGRVTAQPTQINFENLLAAELLKLEKKNNSRIFIEDESKTIGKCGLPLSMYGKMQVWPIIILEDSMENRIEVIKKEYVTDSLKSYNEVYGAEGFAKFSEILLANLARVQKRLGLELYKEIDLLMREALKVQERSGDASAHDEWISYLLSDYYDPMYDYQLSRKTERVIFKGSREEVIEYCKR